jgi:UDP-N-acetylglucosamine 2-epimerase (non-hydrolysing)
MYPVIKRTEDKYVICTGQHRDLIDKDLLTPDRNLNLMKRKQNLNSLVNLLLVHLSWAIKAAEPERIIVQGDTATAFVASMIAFHNGIQLAHIEAGLRTWDKTQPFPEEVYRQFITSVSDIHFCPTWDNYRNVEMVTKYTHHAAVPGNTVVDAIEEFAPEVTYDNVFLVTLHRRESDWEDYGRALLRVAHNHPDYTVRVLIHPNQVGQGLKRVLGYGGTLPNIELLEPLGYTDFLKELAACYLVITDSGGLQEEAPCLNKPVVIMRRITERMENLGRGATLARDGDAVEKAVERLVNDEKYYADMADSHNPFGDGAAGQRIAEVLNQ